MAHPRRAGALVLLLLVSAAACGDDDPPEAVVPATTTTQAGEAAAVADLDGTGVADEFHAAVTALGTGPDAGAAVADGLAVVDGARRLVVTSVLDGVLRRSVDPDRPALYRPYASWDGTRLVVSGTSCPDVPPELPEHFDEYDVGEVCGPEAAPALRALDVATGAWVEVPFPVEADVDDGVIATRHGTALAFTGASDPGIRLTPLETAGWTTTGEALDVDQLAGGGLCVRDDGTLLVLGEAGPWLLGDGEPTAVPERTTDDLVCDHDGNLLVDLDSPEATSLVRVVVDPDGSTRTEALALPAEAAAGSPQLTTTATGRVLWAYDDGRPALRAWIRDGEGWRALEETTVGPDALDRPAVAGAVVIGFAGAAVSVLT